MKKSKKIYYYMYPKTLELIISDLYRALKPFNLGYKKTKVLTKELIICVQFLISYYPAYEKRYEELITTFRIKKLKV